MKGRTFSKPIHPFSPFMHAISKTKKKLNKQFSKHQMLELAKELASLGTAERRDRICSILKERGYEYNAQVFKSKGFAENIVVDLGDEGNENRTIVVCCHYDAPEEKSLAANDTSAIALMINLIEELWEMGLNNKVKFIFFDRSSPKQEGSKHFVDNNNEHIMGVYNLDQVGYGNSFALWPFQDGEEFEALFVLEQKIREKGLICKKFKELLPYGSDHKSFKDKKINAFTITTLTDRELETGQKFLESSGMVSEESLRMVKEVLTDTIIELDRPSL